jgi:hypothetical protein
MTTRVLLPSDLSDLALDKRVRLAALQTDPDAFGSTRSLFPTHVTTDTLT